MYAIADLHGEIKKINNWIRSMERHFSSEEEKLLILGDAGLNYQLDKKDYRLKCSLQSAIEQIKNKGISLELIIVRGNHECRPENIESYRSIEKYGDIIYVEEDFPNLLFLKDGGIYRFDDENFVVIGGGFSDDFLDRLLNGYGIWTDQELSEQEFEAILNNPNLPDNFTVLSHVAPTGLSLQIRNKEKVSSTEKNLQLFLEKYNSQINRWWLGHYHTDRVMNYKGTEFHIVYKNIKLLP